jgi:hypothetical protein
LFPCVRVRVLFVSLLVLCTRTNGVLAAWVSDNSGLSGTGLRDYLTAAANGNYNSVVVNMTTIVVHAAVGMTFVQSLLVSSI